MNKQVIKDNFEAFKWWLDGGTLLILEAKGNWESDYDLFIQDVPHVINDEYVEFRKALAERKTVEMHGEVTHQWLKMSSDNFELAPSEYRIKPDEPTFKVGDYVYDIDRTENQVYVVSNVTKDEVVSDTGVRTLKCIPISKCRLWTLEDASDDEWVAMWSKTDMFFKIMSVKLYRRHQLDYANIVPYIGQSPAQLGLEK